MNRTLAIILISLLTLFGFGQKIIRNGNVKSLVDWKIEIKGNSPECFYSDIPLNYKLNNVDTVYCRGDFDWRGDSIYAFYKGKCDTIHYLDTIELYLEPHTYYTEDSINHLYSLADVSEEMKKMNIENFSSKIDSVNSVWRFTSFEQELPLTININETENGKILIKRIFNGSDIYTEGEKSKDTITLKPREGNKLVKLVSNISSYKLQNKLDYCDISIVFESYEKGIHNSMCFTPFESSFKRNMSRKIKKFNKLIKKY